MSIIRRVPPGWPQPVEGEESEGLAFITDIEGGPLRHAFIRLIPRGTGSPVHTFTADATIDLDEDGNIVGVMVAWEVPPAG